jgi:hypothetical protein
MPGVFVCAHLVTLKGERRLGRSLTGKRRPLKEIFRILPPEWVLPYMSTQTTTHNGPAPGADNHNRESSRTRRRKMIEHQIDTIMERSLTLPPNHPAQRGIERTIEKLNMEAQAED